MSIIHPVPFIDKIIKPSELANHSGSPIISGRFSGSLSAAAQSVFVGCPLIGGNASRYKLCLS